MHDSTDAAVAIAAKSSGVAIAAESSTEAESVVALAAESHVDRLELKCSQQAAELKRLRSMRG